MERKSLEISDRTKQGKKLMREQVFIDIIILDK